MLLELGGSVDPLGSTKLALPLPQPESGMSGRRPSMLDLESSAPTNRDVLFGFMSEACHHSVTPPSLSCLYHRPGTIEVYVRCLTVPNVETSTPTYGVTNANRL